MRILQLTLSGLENYEQREPWATTNEDNKTPFSLDQYEFLPIMKLLSMHQNSRQRSIPLKTLIKRFCKRCKDISVHQFPQINKRLTR